MSGRFMYYVPKHTGSLTASLLLSLGVTHLAGDGDGNPDSAPIPVGPDGGPGILAQYDVPAGQMVTFEPAAQTWQKGPDGRFWVGFANDARPTPDSLARARLYEGTPVRLLDGNDWIVPRCVAMLPGRDVTLPSLLGYADDGKTLITRAHPRYAKLCDDAFRWWQEWTRTAEPGKELSPNAKVQLAMDALGVNYRIGAAEAIGLLGLIGEEELAAILRAIVDADEVDRYLAAQEASAAPAGAGKNA